MHQVLFRSRWFVLIEGGVHGCVLIGVIFQLHHHEGDTVDEEHRVRPFVAAVFYNRELIDYDELVMVGIMKIDQPDQIAPAVAVFLIAYPDAFGEHTVKSFIAGDKFG